MKKILLIILSVCLITGCKEKNLKEELKLNDNSTFEINSEVKISSLISSDNKVNVTNEDEIIDTTTLGKKLVTIKSKTTEYEEETVVEINIVDTTSPLIEYTKELSTTVGTDIDLKENVVVTDNSKEEINVTVLGDYDINKEGVYNLKYEAVDSSNNKTTEEFTLTVNKSDSSNNSTNNKVNNSTSNNTNTSTNNNSNTSTNNNTNNSTVVESSSCTSKKFNNKYTYSYQTEEECKKGGNTAYFIESEKDENIFTYGCEKIVDDCNTTWYGVYFNSFTDAGDITKVYR
jgi:hypothetical protein